MAGVAGGIFLVPLIILLTNISPYTAAGTALGAFVFGSFSASIENRRNGYILPEIAVLFLLGTFPGIMIGVELSESIPALLWKFIFTLIALYLIRRMLKMNSGSTLMEGMARFFNRFPVKISVKSLEQPVSVVGFMAVGTIIGMLSAVMGIGGGFLATPYLHFGLGLDMKKAVATSIFLILLNSLIGATAHYFHGHFDMEIWIVAAAGTFLGGLTGGKALRWISPEIIKKIFATILILAIIMLYARDFLGMNAISR